MIGIFTNLFTSVVVCLNFHSVTPPIGCKWVFWNGIQTTNITSIELSVVFGSLLNSTDMWEAPSDISSSYTSSIEWCERPQDKQNMRLVWILIFWSDATDSFFALFCFCIVVYASHSRADMISETFFYQCDFHVWHSEQKQPPVNEKPLD